MIIEDKKKKFISTNIVYFNKYLEQLEIKEDNYITKDYKIKKRRRLFMDNEYQVYVDDYDKPNKFTMIEVSNGNLDIYKVPNGLIDVTDIEGYQPKEIYNGFIKKTGVFLEGTDAVGKSVTIKELLKQGIICKDRESIVISANMLFEISMEERVKRIEKFLLNHDDIVLFLINNDKEELLRRIYSRKTISDFDLDTYEYNILYKKTYDYMKKHNMLHEKLHCIDCTGLNINKQLIKVKDKIDKYAKY